MVQCDMLTRSVIFLVVGIITGGFIHGLADEPERIVSGFISIEGQYTYVVSLRYDYIFRCGGSIISNKHILTAAHCVHNRTADRFIIRSGTIWREWYGQYHYVSHISQHPGFEVDAVKSHGYDIAVLTLKDPITMDDMHSIIPIASFNTPAEIRVEVHGWGQTKVKGAASEIQRKSYLHTIANNECELRTGKHILDSQLCTREPQGTGTCMGDSGGPLVYNDEVVGIASWVYPCARALPDVFTRVYSFRSFIRDAMRDYP